MKNLIYRSIIIVSFIFSSSVFAIGLDDAKQEGLIGEKDNGYLGMVILEKETQVLVDDINAKRKAVYVKLAAKNGITLQQVEKLAAAKTYEKTISGHYLWMNSEWAKK